MKDEKYVKSIWYYVFQSNDNETMWFQVIYNTTTKEQILEELKEKNDEYGVVISFGELVENENGKWYCKNKTNDTDREIDDNLLYQKFEKMEKEEKERKSLSKELNSIYDNQKEYGNN